MLKIGDFSKLSQITVKALRFYEKEGILMPASIDEWNGYRFYETSQLVTAAKIKALRQLDLSIEEIREIISGGDENEILKNKANELSAEKISIDNRLSIINSILEDREMNYQVTEKIIPEKTVYCSETTLDSVSDVMTWIPSVGEECLKLNPEMKCDNPPYEFLEYLDGEYNGENVRVRHTEAVTSFGKENDKIKFKTLPETKVLGIYHKGGYDKLPEAYAFILKYAEKNGYEITDLPRECYIDGIWNKETEDEWLTEIQLPIK